MNLTSDLQRDIVAAMRAAVPKICHWCAEGLPCNSDGVHAWVPVDCDAWVERALLARADAEIAKGASDAH